MDGTAAALPVRRPDPAVAVISMAGDITGASEGPLMAAYTQADGPGTRAVLLDFGPLGYMNSSGIGLLVTMLVRANRQHQRLLAFGLNDHYRQILSLTRLDEAIQVHPDETSALAAASGRGTGR
ncbi:MAG TPA: STAS domain-containing protein [Candidatus Limnocylindrales bacterium]|jgi:anti-sigma B factor antagonist|nr:STAS domain-containing protein [Candidatus Limnocylindrales bacterium]